MQDILVAIIEDEHELRELFQQIIDRSPGFVCRWSYGDCESALKDLPELRPDVILMDIMLPGMNGIAGTRKLKQLLPSSDIIMLTIQDESELVFQSLCAGATGYLLKDTPPVKLLDAIREVNDGGSPMSPAIARLITNSFRPDSDPDLSERELEVLQLLTKGESYSSIATRLFISGNTVKAHIKNIYKKLQVNTRAEAVSAALRNRIVE